MLHRGRPADTHEALHLNGAGGPSSWDKHAVWPLVMAKGNEGARGRQINPDVNGCEPGRRGLLEHSLRQLLLCC